MRCPNCDELIKISNKLCQGCQIEIPDYSSAYWTTVQSLFVNVPVEVLDLAPKIFDENQIDEIFKGTYNEIALNLNNHKSKIVPDSKYIFDKIEKLWIKLGWEIYKRLKELSDIGISETLHKDGTINNEIHNKEEFEESGQLVIIDGPNIINYEGKGNFGKSKYLKQLISQLEGDYNLKNILVVMSAASEHYIDDQEYLKQLKLHDKVMIAPGNDYDDKYLIEVALNMKGIIISRDHFKDFKDDPKIANLLNRILIKYSINPKTDRFIMPDLYYFSSKAYQ